MENQTLQLNKGLTFSLEVDVKVFSSINASTALLVYRTQRGDIFLYSGPYPLIRHASRVRELIFKILATSFWVSNSVVVFMRLSPYIL